MRLRTTTFAAVMALAPMLLGAHTPDGCRVIDTRSPTDESDDQYVCRQDAFLHAAGSPLANTVAAGHGEVPTWDATPPTDTGGAAYLATIPNEVLPPPANDERLSEATFEGSYVGNIDNIAATLYVSAHANPILPLVTTMAGTLSLEVDGELLFDGPGVANFTSLGNGLYRADWAFTGAYPALNSLGLSGNDVEHAVTISVEPDWPTTFVFDNSEAPSGLVFNVEDITGYRAVPIG